MMNIIELRERNNPSDTKLSRIYVQLGELLKDLKKKELPHKIIESINQDIEEVNSTSLVANELRKLVKQKQTNIIKTIGKELKITPRNYYRNLWLTVGFPACIGVSIGLAFGIGNMGLIAIGLPIGMAIGVLISSKMDKKASNEGRQLDLQIKY